MLVISELSKVAGVSTRTLRYYDKIGLLKPSDISVSGYRLYDDAAVLRLQQILFYKEIGLELKAIASILDDPVFDTLNALYKHKELVRVESRRLEQLVETIDKTIFYLKGKTEMNHKEIFEGFDQETTDLYSREASDNWADMAEETSNLWKSYDDDDKSKIMSEGNQIYAELSDNVDKEPNDSDVQNLVSRWHQHLKYFYEPSKEVLVGLGSMYVNDPRFNAKLSKLNPDLPVFLNRAITVYVNNLRD